MVLPSTSCKCCIKYERSKGNGISWNSWIWSVCINICKFEVYYALCIEDYGWYIERLALLGMCTLIIRKNKHEIVKIQNIEIF